MQPTVTPLDLTLGATLTDVDLSALDDQSWRVVEDAFHQYGLLVFPGQHLTDDGQVAFAERFGPIEYLTGNKKAKAVPISNKRADGNAMGSDEFRYKTLRGNEGWHTDSSYMPLASKASALSALQVPSAGGETEYADMRAAYDALEPAMRERIADLSAYHSLYHSQAKIGVTTKTGDGYGYHTKGAPLRPLVKTHPITGRKSLFIGRHAYGIPGLSEAESEQLLEELLTFACQHPRTYAHQWQVGDLVIWDNRCVLHRACPYDYAEIRVMRHTRVAGDPTTELVETAPDELAADYVPTGSNAFDEHSPAPTAPLPGNV
ncbi:MAG: TauD/TfdA family dioxygenase [Pseudomonadota bacterium]